MGSKPIALQTEVGVCEFPPGCALLCGGEVYGENVFRSFPPFRYEWFLILVPGGSVVKNLPASTGDAGDLGSIPGLGRSSVKGNDNPLQYSCLGNPKDRGVCRPHGGLQSMGSQRVRCDLVT